MAVGNQQSVKSAIGKVHGKVFELRIARKPDALIGHSQNRAFLGADCHSANGFSIGAKRTVFPADRQVSCQNNPSAALPEQRIRALQRLFGGVLCPCGAVIARVGHVHAGFHPGFLLRKHGNRKSKNQKNHQEPTYCLFHDFSPFYDEYLVNRFIIAISAGDL